MDKTQAFECGQVFVRGSRWIPQGRPVTADGRKHRLGVGIEKPGDERVGMLCRESVGGQAVSRKVPQVAGHDHVRLPFDRGGQHMDVVGVRGVESGGTSRVTRHNRFGKVPVHYHPGSFQHSFREIGTVCQNAPYPLCMDVCAPRRRVQVLVGETQKNVPEAGRIEDVGVEQRREEGQGLLQAEVLIESGELIQRLAPTGFRLAAVVDDVLDPDTAMRAYLAAGNSAFVQQLDQMRSRYLQEVGCLTRREFRMQRCQCHAVAVRHLVKDFPE